MTDIPTIEMRRLRERGLTFKDIADRLGCSDRTVSKRLGGCPDYGRTAAEADPLACDIERRIRPAAIESDEAYRKAMAQHYPGETFR